MTREGHGIGPEETPPPARTRWSEAEAGDDAGLIPPFVPGRRQAPPEPDASVSGEPDVAFEPEPEETPVSEVIIPDPPAEPEPVFPWSEPLDEPQGSDPWAEESGGDPWGDQGLEEAWGGVPEMDLDEVGSIVPPELGGSESRAQRLAAQLEAFAEALRSDGLSGVQSELNSPDRITAVLAALLSGYLAGAEE